MNLLLRLIIVLIILILPLSLQAKIRDYISIKTEKNISLSDLIKSSGFEIEDDRVTPFLEDFLRLNEDIKSLRMIPKGTTVRLPSKYLKKRTGATREKGFEPRPEVAKDKEIELVIRNIKGLFDHLGEFISVSLGKIIVFPVTEKASLSIDTDYFPMIEISGRRMILLDLKKTLPDEIRDIIEVYWPEYTVIRGRDMKGIVNQVLDSIDYTCIEEGRVVIGDDMLVEIKPDCIIMRKGKDIMDSDMIILGITKKDEFGFPHKLLKWAKESGISIIDLHMRKKPLFHKEANLFVLPEHKEGLILGLLDHLGYKVRRDVGLSIAEKGEYTLNLLADIVFKSGKRTKVIDLSGLPQPAIGILRRHGIDIISIDIGDNSRKIIEDILNFLSVPSESHLEKVSQMITPGKVKYRVRTQGIVVKTKKGNLLLSNYHDSELLKSIINEKISLIKYN